VTPDEAAVAARFADRWLRAEQELRVLRADLDKAAGQVQGLSGLGRSFQDLAATVAELASRIPPPEAPARGYTPAPAPKWHLLTADEMGAAVARLRAWVNGIYRPRYGHLARGLGECWEQHLFALVTLDWLSELWLVLYQRDTRPAGFVQLQAEYGTRVLPVAADLLRTETTGCGHQAIPAGNGVRHA